MDVRHGSSGAMIHVGEEHVMKYGYDDVGVRVAAQGRWLRDYPSPAVPRVLSWFPDGYVMPRLRELDRSEPHDVTYLDAVAARLAEHVWTRAPNVKLDLALHQLKVERLAHLHAPELERRLMQVGAGEIDWDVLPTCLTHGDPTWDNVMSDRRSEGLVIIDPIPASPAVPDLRCVDFGKMLQSVVGYERIRYREPGIIAEPEDVRALCQDDNEWNATWYWCAVHLLRCAPYVGEEVWNELRRLGPLRDL